MIKEGVLVLVFLFLIVGVSGVDFFKEDFDSGAPQIPDNMSDNKEYYEDNSDSENYDGSFDVQDGKISEYEGADLDFERNGGSFVVSDRKIVGYYNDLSNDNIKVETKKSKIVVGKPVKWVKKVSLNKSGLDLNQGLSVVMSNEVSEISIKTGDDADKSLSLIDDYGALLEEVDRKDLVSGRVTGFVSADVEKNKNFLSRFIDFVGSIFLKGDSLDERELIESKRLAKDSRAKEIDLTEIAFENDEIVIEYYTEGPNAVEIDTGYGKIVNVSSRGEMGYENILSYSELDKEVPKENIEFYHLKEDGREAVDFESKDLNDNGLVDYVEWEVPHLSSQIYEIVIHTSLAFSTDKNGKVIKNVYESIDSLDGKFTEVIKPGQYLKVTFESELDNSRDITIYAKSEGKAFVEVYKENEDDVIAVFKDINKEGDYQIFLDKLVGKEDTFYLRVSPVSEKGVQFDYIVNPFVFDSGVLSEKDSDKDTYYEISDCSELQGMIYNLERNYELVNNIDCDGYNYVVESGEGFRPIGDSSEGFNGNFNGNGFFIKGIYIDRPELEEVGLFGVVKEESLIKDVAVVDVDFKGGNYVGGFTSKNYGSIKNSFVVGEISGGENIAGFVFSDKGEVENCYASVELNLGEEGFVKGFVGEGILTGISNLDISKAQSLIFSSELPKSVSFSVKNVGKNFLNRCKFIPDEKYSLWLKGSEEKNIAAGEEVEYNFMIEVPENVESGSYEVDLNFNCKEVKHRISIPVDVIQKQFHFELLDASREDDELNITYSIRELSGKKQDIDMDFKLLDSDDETIADIEEEVILYAEDFKTFSFITPIESSFEGEIELYVNMNSESYSLFEQEDILISKKPSVSGFAVKDSGFKIQNILYVVLIAGILGFVGLKLWKRFKVKKPLTKEEKRKELFKEFDEDSNSGGMDSFA